MIGNHFTFQSSDNFFHSDFNQSLQDSDVRRTLFKSLSLQCEPCICSAAPMMLLNDLVQMGIPPEVYLAHLLNGLPQYSFYIIANECHTDEQEVQMSTPYLSEELEIECIDMRSNLEKVAKAVEKQAFVAFKKGTLETTQAEMKITPKWEKLLKEGEIQKIKIKKDELSKGCHEINGCDLKFSTFTIQEVDEISTILFKVIDIACQIRAIEQQKKEAEEKWKRAQQDIQNRKKCNKQLLVHYSRERMEKKDEIPVSFNPTPSLKAIQKELMQQRRITKRQDEKRQVEDEVERDEKRLRIVNRAIIEYTMNIRFLQNLFRRNCLSNSYTNHFLG